jgi:hypothetical protein
MKDSKNNDWLWFAIPFFLVIVGVVLFVLFSEPAQDSPFTYGQ